VLWTVPVLYIIFFKTRKGLTGKGAPKKKLKREELIADYRKVIIA
jgi:hypothetical protein